MANFITATYATTSFITSSFAIVSFIMVKFHKKKNQQIKRRLQIKNKKDKLNMFPKKIQIKRLLQQIKTT